MPGKVGDGGRSGANNRTFVEAVLWIASTGLHGGTCRRASATGTPTSGGPGAGRSRVSSTFFLNDYPATPISNTPRSMAPLFGSTSRAPAQEGTHRQAIGRSRGGLTTKITALVDALGNLVRFVLLPGQCHDLVEVTPLI